MLIDWTYNDRKLLVSYIDKEGKFKYKHLNWQNPKQWIVDQNLPVGENDPHTWDGYRCIQVPVRRPDKYAVFDFLENLPDDEKEDIINYRKEPNIYFIDIETRADDGFPDPLKAPSEVTLISVSHKRKVALLGTRILDKTQIDWISNQTKSYLTSFGMEELEVKYEQFESEFSLLKYFFELMLPQMNVISGWNISGFDWPYLVTRANKLSQRRGQKIDIFKASPNREYGRGSKGFTADVPRHKLMVDYMKLYDKFDTSVKVKESSSLNWVSNKILKVQKVHYPGTLEQLLAENYPLYCFYNVVDSLLVQLIHEKQQYINIMYATADLSKIRTIDTLSAIAVTEGFLRKPLYDRNKIVFVKTVVDDIDEDEDSIEGGYVKDPEPGMSSWVSVMDFNSLYPTTQRTFSIVPENYKGRCIIEGEKKWAIREGREKVEINDTDIITVNGCVFTQNPSPTKDMLAKIYNDRKKYKGLKEASYEKLKEVRHNIAELEKLLV